MRYTADEIFATQALSEAHSELELIHRGKVRDVFAWSKSELVIVASDRLSAFDVVLPDPIPAKGAILTQLSNFWFEKTAHLGPNHLLDPARLPTGFDPRRSVLCKRLKALPIEAIARGYLVGSGHKEYLAQGAVSGIALPSGLALASRLPEALFTPSTKAQAGEHDENISFKAACDLLGTELAQQVRERTLAIYQFAAEFALTRGIIIADTKLEFGLDEDGVLHVMDEMLTPDSSRFWPQSDYRVGSNPPSFDKQFARDYLESIAWNKAPPAPVLPSAVIEGTQLRYQRAYLQLTGAEA